ncbi:unnamed protein product [Onchocerca flexuosa]|uniref:Uncharacterized protein n=1 Tax=Onchocerca flexuosa TaxID=387005 RepID=A0A183HX29_9BILA|nr:unnamed protein product [Onchocerca flexuosa]
MTIMRCSMQSVFVNTHSAFGLNRSFIMRKKKLNGVFTILMKSITTNILMNL